MSDEPSGQHQPPPIPPIEPPKTVLSHQRPPAMPMGVQALLGVVISVPTLFVIACLLIGGAASLSGTTTGTVVGVGGCGLIALVVLGVTLYYARELRHEERTRGWAIGIYIGLGLTALFWGTCGLILASLSYANFH